ncbi:MAG: M17 family peptidase N-terminal domain-containing protein, partial [Pseudomonadota bacterium]
MEIAFAASELPQTGTVVVLLAGTELAATGVGLDEQTGGALGRAIEMSAAPIKRGKVIDVLCPSGLAVARIVILALGDPSEIKRLDLEVLGGGLAAKLKGLGVSEAHVAV